MRYTRLDEAQDEMKTTGRKINNLRYADDPTFMGESEEELMKFITSWQLDGETMEIVRNFLLGGSKITADGDCSLEIKKLLILGRKAMANLDSICNSRDITLPPKVHLVQAMVFPVNMYGCEKRTIKLSTEDH